MVDIKEIPNDERQYLTIFKVHKIKNPEQYGGWTKKIYWGLTIASVLLMPLVGLVAGIIGLRSSNEIKKQQGLFLTLVGIFMVIMFWASPPQYWANLTGSDTDHSNYQATAAEKKAKIVQNIDQYKQACAEIGYDFYGDNFGKSQFNWFVDSWMIVDADKYDGVVTIMSKNYLVFTDNDYAQKSFSEMTETLDIAERQTTESGKQLKTRKERKGTFLKDWRVEFCSVVYDEGAARSSVSKDGKYSDFIENWKPLTL